MNALNAVTQPRSVLTDLASGETSALTTNARARISRRNVDVGGASSRATEPMHANDFVDVLRALVRDVVREELTRDKSPPEPAGHLSTRAAAEHAGVAMGTIRRWIRDGKLPELRAGRHLRVRRADVDALLGGDRTGPDASPEDLARQAFGG
jgi:excisionase family DNA binding protein